MNKEQLETRMKELEQIHQNIQQQGLQVYGAMQDCQYWLDQLNKPAEEPKVDDNSTN